MKVLNEPEPPSRQRFASLLEAKLAGACLVNKLQIDQLYRHYEKLVRWNKVLNLTSIRCMEDVIARHYCESLFLAANLPAVPLSVVDIGSGAGFPGIPVAVFRPDCTVTLVESHKRKAVFLREATRDIPNIVVRPLRAESASGRFDCLVARAVPLENVVRVGRRLATSVALLVGQADARKLTESSELNCAKTVLLPWGKRRVLLVGSVPLLADSA